jgi:hypothetical protein
MKNGMQEHCFNTAHSLTWMSREVRAHAPALAVLLACTVASGCVAMPAEDDSQMSQAVDRAPEVPVADATSPKQLVPDTKLRLQGDKATALAAINSDFVSFSFTWSQGQPPVPMGSSAELFCFLTEIQGNFAGGGEMVRIFDSGGSWWLGGASQQSGVAARALCISTQYFGQTLAVSGEFPWVQGTNATFLGADTNRVCFLTRVSGKFQGGGERVEAFTSGGGWWLGGASQQAGVAGGARCVNTVFRNGPYFWSQGQLSTIMSDASLWSCGLTRATGNFEGGGEQVVAFTSGGSWFLGGNSRQGGIATTGYCL